MSLADQKMVTMAETVLASFVAQVRSVAFYSLSTCGDVVGDCVELARRPDNSYDSNCVFVRLVPRPLLPWYHLHMHIISQIFMGFVK
jgi:hypothetical protein